MVCGRARPQPCCRELLLALAAGSSWCATWWILLLHGLVLASLGRTALLLFTMTEPPFEVRIALEVDAAIASGRCHLRNGWREPRIDAATGLAVLPEPWG